MNIETIAINFIDNSKLYFDSYYIYTGDIMSHEPTMIIIFLSANEGNSDNSW